MSIKEDGIKVLKQIIKSNNDNIKEMRRCKPKYDDSFSEKFDEVIRALQEQLKECQLALLKSKKVDTVAELEDWSNDLQTLAFNKGEIVSEKLAELMEDLGL